MNRFDLHHKHPAACLHAVGPDASSTRTLLLSLSTIAGTKISNPSWVNFQSAGWVSFQSFSKNDPRRNLIHFLHFSALPGAARRFAAPICCITRAPLLCPPINVDAPSIGLTGLSASGDGANHATIDTHRRTGGCAGLKRRQLAGAKIFSHCFRTAVTVTSIRTSPSRDTPKQAR